MGYEHLTDPLHILIEAELPANIIDARLKQAQEIIEELLKPVVSEFICNLNSWFTISQGYCEVPLLSFHGHKLQSVVL